MTESANVRGDGKDVVDGGLVKEPWVRLTNADRESLLPQEVPRRQKLFCHAQPPLCLFTCNVSRAQPQALMRGTRFEFDLWGEAQRWGGGGRSMMSVDTSHANNVTKPNTKYRNNNPRSFKFDGNRDPLLSKTRTLVW
ncbi:hypothetical protein TIFTF001_028388 [Ficus carica]|uniref:Uncharacterized protein n=1 Tax=Ficus carica TaxID=3494 RepID=A0AA88DPW2_FICCA|nr:hypothetical protein TIFTF001_028388 [Ficus carica]